MDEDVTGTGGRLGKRPSESGIEVDYKTKAGTAWSHSYLNQKPWHPLSYPNQRRKWIAEQTHAARATRAEEVAREFAQEQEFFRQTALFSKKEKEKVEMMKSVSFMYVRPPGYNPESAKAAEISDEQKRLGQTSTEQNPTEETSSKIPDTKDAKNQMKEKKPRPKDVFGRPLPTEEEFEVLKNAPRLETGVPVRIKPFGVEIRNVRCVRCGTFGHQSGDRECPLKDVIMPNEEIRLKRDDPLTAIMAQTESSEEPLKWELKQKPGMSPPRGGFRPDDPNQQIVAEDIFDEYGGFLGGGEIPPLLTNFSAGKPKKRSKKKSKHKGHPSGAYTEHKNHQIDDLSSSDLETREESKKGPKKRHANRHRSVSYSSSSDSESEKECRWRQYKDRNKKKHQMRAYSSPGSDVDRSSRRDSKRKHRIQQFRGSSSSDTEADRESRRKSTSKCKRRNIDSNASDSYDSDHNRHHHRRKHRHSDRLR